MAFKRSDCLLIQQASDVTKPLLLLTLAIHANYCNKHDIDYLPLFGLLTPDEEKAHWEKLHLLKVAFEAGYEKVIFLDCDCLIVTQEDLREAIPEKAFGFTWHEADWQAIDPENKHNLYNHHNIGAIYVENCVQTQKFLNLWLNTPDEGHCWQAQHSLKRTVEDWGNYRTDKPPVVTIDTRWNSTIPNQMSENPAALAWHGYGNLQERFSAMIEAVQHFYAPGSKRQADTSARTEEEAFEKAKAFMQAEDWEAAAIMLQNLLCNDPNNPLLWKLTANAATHLKQHTAAVGLLQQCIANDPKDGDAWRMLCGCYTYLGEQALALEAAEESVRWGNGAPEAHVNHSLCLLREGRWTEGFAEYEWNFLRDGGRKYRSLKPLWDGMPTDTLFVWTEEGLGDTLMLSTLLPQLMAQGLAKKIVFEVQPPLVALYTNQIPNVRVISGQLDKSTPFHYDAQIGTFSLPRVLQITPEKVQEWSKKPLLNLEVPLHKMKEWEQRLSGEFKVGFQFQGNPAHGNDWQRSIPAELFDSLVEIPNVSFYCLQRDIAISPEALQQVKEENQTVQFIGEYLRDMTDTAAVIAQMDLVITVDTAVLHLAGLLGTPAWGLISKASDWRWLIDRQDSVWYKSVKLYRQKTLGDWGEILSRVERDLRLLTAPSLCPSCQAANEKTATHCQKCSKPLRPTLSLVRS